MEGMVGLHSVLDNLASYLAGPCLGLSLPRTGPLVAGVPLLHFVRVHDLLPEA